MIGEAYRPDELTDDEGHPLPLGCLSEATGLRQRAA